MCFCCKADCGFVVFCTEGKSFYYFKMKLWTVKISKPHTHTHTCYCMLFRFRSGFHATTATKKFNVGSGKKKLSTVHKRATKYERVFQPVSDQLMSHKSYPIKNSQFLPSLSPRFFGPDVLGKIDDPCDHCRCYYPFEKIAGKASREYSRLPDSSVFSTRARVRTASIRINSAAYAASNRHTEAATYTESPRYTDRSRDIRS